MAEDRKRSADLNCTAISVADGRPFSRTAKGNQTRKKPAVDMMEKFKEPA